MHTHIHSYISKENHMYIKYIHTHISLQGNQVLHSGGLRERERENLNELKFFLCVLLCDRFQSLCLIDLPGRNSYIFGIEPLTIRQVQLLLLLAQGAGKRPTLGFGLKLLHGIFHVMVHRAVILFYIQTMSSQFFEALCFCLS